MKIFIPFILLFIRTILPAAEVSPPRPPMGDQDNWRTQVKTYSNESITFFLSGDLKMTDKPEIPGGDNWIGTGIVLGIDGQARLRFFGSYIKGVKDGWFLVAPREKEPPRSMDWFKCVDGKELIHKLLTWDEAGKPKLDGHDIPIVNQ